MRRGDHSYCRKLGIFAGSWRWAIARRISTCRSTITGSVKSKCGVLARLRPEPSAKIDVGLETAVIHRNSSDQNFRRKR